MRAVISQVFFEVFDKRPLDEVERRAGGQPSSGCASFRNVTPSVGPHAAYTVSLEGLAMAYRLAERLDVLVHFHLAETEHELREFRKRHGQGLVRGAGRGRVPGAAPGRRPRHLADRATTPGCWASAGSPSAIARPAT